MGYQLDQKLLLVRHPLHLVVEHRVQANSLHLMYFARLSIPDPQLNRFLRKIHECEAFSVGGPDRHARACVLRQRHMRLRTVCDMHQIVADGAGSNAVAARSVVLAVIPCLNPHTCKAQEGCRHP